MGIFFRDDDDNNEEEYTGQTGDPLHDAVYGWDLGSTSGGYDYKTTGTGRKRKDSRIEGYGKKAWDLYMDFKEKEALSYINMALDLDNKHANNWNRKAIILEGMKRYAESEECYNRSLELRPQNLVYDNKARMLYDWSARLLEESKDLSDGSDMLREAKEIIIKAMKSLPGENSEEDIEKYLNKLESIEFYIKYEKEYQSHLETLKAFHKDELFTIAGKNFYSTEVKLLEGLPLKLVKESDNEYDSDAIAVYADDKKIGYVANNENTRHPLTSSAKELQSKISDTCQGRYMFHLQRYNHVDFHIARIIR